MSATNFATLREDSPFYPIFEGGRIPIKNILVPEVGNMINGGGLQEYYRADVALFTMEQFVLVAEMVAGQCHSTPEEAANTSDDFEAVAEAWNAGEVSSLYNNFGSGGANKPKLPDCQPAAFINSAAPDSIAGPSAPPRTGAREGACGPRTIPEKEAA